MQKKEQEYDYDWEDRWIDTYLVARGVYRVETRASQSAGEMRIDAQSRSRNGKAVRRKTDVSRDIG